MHRLASLERYDWKHVRNVRDERVKEHAEMEMYKRLDYDAWGEK